jgi:glycerophosphoryl diester phosphodiesterase
MWFLKRFVIVLLCVVALLWLVNTNIFVQVPKDQRPKLIAHRGIHQIYAGDDRSAETCAANPVGQITHPFIANTMPSIVGAFAHGADVVEVDVHLTSDGKFAVFHDWTLDCQTDGFGVTHDRDMNYLRGLDLGFGYTSDGKTYPLRGTAVGQMPTLFEILGLGGDHGKLLVNFKSNRIEEGQILANRYGASGTSIWGVYGGSAPTQAALANSDWTGFDRQTLKSCLLRYALTGWTGRAPAVCAHMTVAVPMDYAPYLWGWPHKFTRRMRAVGTEVILWGPYDGSGFSSGIDDAETLARVPDRFDGYIWTNRIELIGPLLR